MQRTKAIYLTIIVTLLLLVSGLTYYGLGGFDELEVYEFEGGERTVIGKHYIGRFTNKETRAFMLEARELIESEQLKGKLTLIEYQNDTIGSDSTHFFIGASFDEIRGILEIPTGFTYEEFRTDKIYRVFITQHVLVSPSPTQIRGMMEVEAINDGKVLEPFTFDLYYEDGSWCTEGWTK